MLSPVGIVEPTRAHGDPPGTHLFDPPETEETLASSRLKRHPRNHQIILRPQPSDSPRDPLNWSTLRKETLFVVILMLSLLTGVIGPIFVPAIGTLSEQFDVPVAKIAQLNGILVFIEGKLFPDLSAFFGYASSYESIYGSRIISGAGMAGGAVSVGQTIVDMYFTYEHGFRVALWQVSYCASINITPVISGYIVADSGWPYVFYAFAAFQGATLIALVFFCPETAYSRAAVVDDAGEVIADKHQVQHIENHDAEKDASSTPASGSTALAANGANEHPLSFVETLKPFSGLHSKDGIFVTIAQPVAVVFAPQIFWALLAYTQAFSWFVGTGATYSQIYAQMYYSESVPAVGLISGIAPLVGSVLACGVSGPLTDWAARYLSKRNHGIFEPEFRLVTLVPAVICTTIGGYIWACMTGPEYDLMIGTVMGGFCIAGATFALCGTVGYINACYPKQAGATFAIHMILSRAAIFGQTYIWKYVLPCLSSLPGEVRTQADFLSPPLPSPQSDWLATNGVKQFFVVFTSVSIGLWLFGGVIWVFGKVIRARTAKSRILGWACS
ncbi:hypothetical protein JCM10207_002795 [Rhodosporidiobolus poonsookiae]